MKNTEYERRRKEGGLEHVDALGMGKRGRKARQMEDEWGREGRIQ
jgi:hypothetical protein